MRQRPGITSTLCAEVTAADESQALITEGDEGDDGEELGRCVSAPGLGPPFIST
jgi:hypothetical protein